MLERAVAGLAAAVLGSLLVSLRGPSTDPRARVGSTRLAALLQAVSMHAFAGRSCSARTGSSCPRLRTARLRALLVFERTANTRRWSGRRQTAQPSTLLQRPGRVPSDVTRVHRAVPAHEQRTWARGHRTATDVLRAGRSGPVSTGPDPANFDSSSPRSSSRLRDACRSFATSDSALLPEDRMADRRRLRAHRQLRAGSSSCARTATPTRARSIAGATAARPRTVRQQRSDLIGRSTTRRFARRRLADALATSTSGRAGTTTLVSTGRSTLGGIFDAVRGACR